MKKLLCSALALCTTAGILCSCSFSEKAHNQVGTNPSVAESIQKSELVQHNQKRDWKQLFIDYIASEDWSDGCNYVGAHDLNFDGTPELILGNSAASAAYSFGVFVLDDNEVKHLCGFTTREEKNSVAINNIGLYSNYDDNWLTLRKNTKTGELKYVMYSRNAGYLNEFGNTISFGPGKNGEVSLINEFEYNIDYDESDWETIVSGNYFIAGKQVSSEEFTKATEAYEKTWVDTGVRVPVMTLEHCNYSNKMPVSHEKSDLEHLFNLYKKEF